MFTQAGSMLLFSSVFFCEGLDVTVEQPVKVTIGIDSGKSFQTTKWNTLYFPDKPSAWIKMGWMWSSDSISHTTGHIKRLVFHTTFHIKPKPSAFRYMRHSGGAIILGEPAANNP